MNSMSSTSIPNALNFRYLVATVYEYLPYLYIYSHLLPELSYLIGSPSKLIIELPSVLFIMSFIFLYIPPSPSRSSSSSSLFIFYFC